MVGKASGYLGLAVAAILFATGAVAKESEPVDTSARLLQRMDRDGDGQIAYEEYRNAMSRRFHARDRNGDGTLDGDEFPREWVAGSDAMAANGKVTHEEFAASLQPVFDQFDANKDGKLDAGEIRAFTAARQANEGAKP